MNRDAESGRRQSSLQEASTSVAKVGLDGFITEPVRKHLVDRGYSADPEMVSMGISSFLNTRVRTGLEKAIQAGLIPRNTALSSKDQLEMIAELLEAALRSKSK